MQRASNVVEERDREFPSFRRRDVKQWSRWKFYPGAFLILVPKLLSLVVVLSFAAILLQLLFLG